MNNEQLIEDAGKRAGAVLGNQLADLKGKWSMLKPDGVPFSLKALAELIAEREGISVGQAAKLTPREACEALERYLNPPGPVVILRGQGVPPLVFGKPVSKALNEGQYVAVQALLDAGPDGLNKTELEGQVPYGGVRGTIDRLSKNAEWKGAILMGGAAYGRYRIAHK